MFIVYDNRVPLSDRRHMKKTLLIVGAVGVIALALSSCAPGPTTLEKVYDECNLSEGVRIGDEGDTLSLDMIGEEDYSGASIEDVVCLVNSPLLKMPEFIISGIETTRALDGKQTGEWDNFQAEWSYHPNHGLDLMIHQK